MGAHRFSPSPLQRGTAAVAVAGGALTLIGATTPALLNDAAQIANARPDVAPLAQFRTLEPAAAAPLVGPPVLPVTPAPVQVDAAGLVKAVQLADQEIARLAAERAVQEQAAQQKAAEDKAAADRAAAERAARKKAAATAKAAPARAAATGSPDCDLDTSSLGSVKAHVRDAANFLGCLFGEPKVLGVGGRAGDSDHPKGLALDFMVDRATGDALAACALRNQDALGVSYVIWRQRINTGSGFRAMEDRGSATANHFDHVHVSFDPSRGTGDFRSC